MDFELYGEDQNALVKFDPRTKFVVFAASLAVSANSYNVLPLVIYSALLCGMLFLCGKKAAAVKALALLLFGAFLRFQMERAGTGAPVVVTIVSCILMIFLFFFPMLLSILILTQTTRINQFLAAFQAMHLPAAVIIPLAVMFRFIPTVRDEWTGIRKAMAFRGISLEPVAILRSPLKTVEYILIPLLFSSVSIMEQLAAAALARGMDCNGTRISYEKVQLHAQDWLAMLLFLAAAVYFIQSAMAELCRDKTTLVVAHRLYTVRNADQILVLENGRICESGTHSELLACGGLYSRMEAANG